MRSSASLIVFITECAFLFLFLGGGKNKSNKKLKEKASTYNPSLMIPRMFKLTHPFLLRIITSKTSFLQIKLLFFGLVFLLHHISDSSSDVGFGLVMNNSGLSVSPCFSVFFSHKCRFRLTPCFSSSLWLSPHTCAAPGPSSGKGGVTFLPGRDVAVMHVGSHHHAGSASVALKRREIVRESTTDCIFRAMTASQEQFKTLDLFF